MYDKYNDNIDIYLDSKNHDIAGIKGYSQCSEAMSPIRPEFKSLTGNIKLRTLIGD